MNAKVHPAIVALVLLLTGLSVVLYAAGRGKALELGGPALLLVAPDGHLYVQIQNTLLEHDASGRFLRRHDLAAIGVEVLIGGVAFFADGDLLLRRGADPRSLTDKLRAFARKENRQPLDVTGPGMGLYRCRLEAADCEVFGDTAIDPRAGFSVFIDDDAVYLSDTSRHRLRRYSADGKPLAPPARGFRFPNQLAVVDGRLHVADTNNHRIAVVESGVEAFGRVIEAFDVVPEDAQRADHRWPAYFARVGRHWWVNNMNSAMEYGGIYIFDANWRYLRRADLPHKADPIQILPFGDDVLVSDWHNDRVHRLSVDGSLLDSFSSQGLDAIVGESQQRRFFYRALAYAGPALLALLFGLLFLRAALDGQLPARRS